MTGCRTVRVAVAGCGVVGGELVRSIRASAARVERAHGVRLEIVRVLVRRPELPRLVELEPGVITADIDAFLSTEAEVVAEAIGGIDPPLRIARATLERGVPFVTANKALIASAGVELARRAAEGRTGLFFEAAVAGGVPVVRVVREYIGCGVGAAVRAPVRRIRGILNGTCNFVLTQLERGMTLADAVADAQRRGFAEADPSRDLDGVDAADKIAILAWLAFGAPPHELHVERRGLLPDGERLVRGAAAAGARLRLIGECAANGASVRASVAPIVVAADSAFGRTVDEENRIAVEVDWSWPIELAGPGAGGVPTSGAMLADILQATTSSAFASPAGLPSSSTQPLDGVAEAAAVVLASPSAIQPRDEPPASDATWLLGVRAGAARDTRARLEVAGLPAVPLGANGGDAWLAVGPVDGLALASVLRKLEHAGARPATARIDDPRVLAPSRDGAPLRRAALAAGGVA